MKNETTLSALGLMCRLIIGGIFLYAGFLKLTAPPEEFAAAIEAYKIIPPSMAIWVAHAASWSEIYLGMFLVAGFFTRLSSMALGSMLAFFMLALTSTLLRKIKLLDCGCFGSGGGRTAPSAILEDIVLLLITIMAFRYGDRLLAIDTWINKSPKESK